MLAADRLSVDRDGWLTRDREEHELGVRRAVPDPHVLSGHTPDERLRRGRDDRAGIDGRGELLGLEQRPNRAGERPRRGRSRARAAGAQWRGGSGLSAEVDGARAFAGLEVVAEAGEAELRVDSQLLVREVETAFAGEVAE